MSADWLRHPAAPLLAFGDALGIGRETLIGREEVARLSYSDESLARERATALSLAQLTDLSDAYGDALTCRLRLGDLPVLEVAPGLDQSHLDAFRGQTEHSPTVALDLRLDKARLAQRWLGDTPGCRPRLYLFPQRLAELLRGDLGTIERRLWDADVTSKVILLVPEHEIWLDGDHLAVVGGDRITDWRRVLPSQPRGAAAPLAMYRTCRDNLKWQEPWLRHLTPLHLAVTGTSQPDDAIANAVRVHLANAVVLYTADRTSAGAGGRWQAVYAGATQTVALSLGDPGEQLDEDATAGVTSLARIAEWAYDVRAEDPGWSTDRLALVQIAVAQALHAADREVRFRLLLRNAPGIYDGLQWHWKAFIERKMDGYTAEVRQLEDDVAGTVQSFADQVADMIKSLSETMLAAVGALLGAFIAALFKDEFNPTVFRLGMMAYAAYVMLFPLVYGMTHHWQRFRALTGGFGVRRERFKERLFPEKVDDIVGRQVTEGEERFRRWFWATVVAYVVVVLLALVMAVRVPGAIGAATPGATSTSVPPSSSPTPVH